MAVDLASRATEDLQDLLAANASRRPAPSGRRKLGGREAPGNDGWVSIPGAGEIHLTRSQPFTPWEGRIFGPYGAALRDLEGVPDVVARAAEADILPRAIAVQLGGVRGEVVEDAIRFLLAAATSTYEGQSISINVALDLGLASSSPAFANLHEYAKSDWYAVLGSGAATGILVNQEGGVVEIVDLHELMATTPIAPDSLYPDAFRYLGRWAEDSDDRIALSLTRTRELLIQAEGSLRYIFRSGRWRSLPLANAAYKAWSHGARIAPPVKKAVLASAIDASLAHHGACLAVIAPGHVTAFNTANVVAAADRWPSSARSAMFGSSNFLSLTRRQRVELLSMDGATVLDRNGEILAAGAIVKVPGGSSGGGRLAATRALATFGAALKISQDGPIRLFGSVTGGAVDELMRLA